VQTDQDPLHISIITKDAKGETLVVGRFQITLRDYLGDQLVHDDWLKLKGNNQCKGVMHVSLQWIFSEV
jgi:Ca2+-dependent lipid-binding protein